MAEKEVVFKIKAEADGAAVSNIEAIEAKLQALHDLSSITLKVTLDESVESNLKLIEDRIAKLHERSELTLRVKLDSSVEASLNAIEERLDRLHQKSNIDITTSGQPGRDPATGRFTSNKPPSQKAPTTKPRPVPRMKTPTAKPIKIGSGRMGAIASFGANSLKTGVQFGSGGAGKKAVQAGAALASFLPSLGSMFGSEGESSDQPNWNPTTIAEMEELQKYRSSWNRSSSWNTAKQDFNAGYEGSGRYDESSMAASAIRTAGDWTGANVIAQGIAGAGNVLAQPLIRASGLDTWGQEDIIEQMRTNEGVSERATAYAPIARRLEEQRIAELRRTQQYESMERAEDLAQGKAAFNSDIAEIRLAKTPSEKRGKLNTLDYDLDEREAEARNVLQAKGTKAAEIENAVRTGNLAMGDEGDAKAARREAIDAANRVREIELERLAISKERIAIVKEEAREGEKAAQIALRASQTQLRELDRKRATSVRERDKQVEDNETASERFAEMGALDQVRVLRAKAKADRGDELDAPELKALKSLGPSDAIERIRKSSSQKVSEEFGFNAAFGDTFESQKSAKDKEIADIDSKKSETESKKSDIEKQIAAIKETERENTLKITEASRALSTGLASTVEKLLADVVRQFEVSLSNQNNGG
jgi:hypothetical protein